jgi:hypothetical protein
MRSPFEEVITPSSGGSFKGEVGKRYTFEVIDAAFRKDVIANRKKGLFDDSFYILAANKSGAVTRRGLKEKANLTPEQIVTVENAPAPTWGKDGAGDPKPRYSDFYTFILKEVESGATLGLIDKNAGWVMRLEALEYEVPGGIQIPKGMYTLYRGMTGKDPIGAFKIGDVLNIGTKFTAKMKSGYNNSVEIDPESILAPGMEPPVTESVTPTNTGELSANGKAVMQYLVDNKDKVNGQTRGKVMSEVMSTLANTMQNSDIVAGWQEVRDRIVDASGNVNVKA